MPKTATIRRQAGKWFVCIVCEVLSEPLPPSDEALGDEALGLDAGLNSFPALSNGEFVENPRFFRKDEQALAKAGRKQAKTKKRSLARRKANKVLSRIHERIRNHRHDFVHQTARRLVNRFGVRAAALASEPPLWRQSRRFGVRAVEKLNVKNMLGNLAGLSCLRVSDKKEVKRALA